jgi:hypothetical protein
MHSTGISVSSCNHGATIRPLVRQVNIKDERFMYPLFSASTSIGVNSNDLYNIYIFFQDYVLLTTMVMRKVTFRSPSFLFPEFYVRFLCITG